MKKFLQLILLASIISSSCTNETANLNNLSDNFNTSVSNVREIRDWNKYPAIVNIKQSEDIIALGDMHGDYDNMLKLLKSAKIIRDIPVEPSQVVWTAGKSVLVCTGDMIDKWTKSLKVITLLKVLREKAKESGGELIITLGNHEAEFLADPNNSKAVEFVSELKEQGINPFDVASGKHPVGSFLRSLPFAARVGKWFFVHAGNTSGRTFNQLASDLQSGVDKDGFSSKVLIDDNSLLEARLSPSPWWEIPGKNPESVLKSYTSALEAEHIVMGHQPGKVEFSDGTTRNKGSLFQKFGLIFLIDVGMSQGADNNTGVVLKIHTSPDKTTATGIFEDGRTNLLWSGN